MQSMLNTRAKKLLTGAVLAGLMGAGVSTAKAALLIDVRRTGFAFGDPAGKTINVNQGDSTPISLSIYLRGGDTDLPNGLGNFALGIRSFGETQNVPTSPAPWSVAPSPTDTVVNANGGTNDTNNAIMDLGFSAGSNLDSGGAGSPDTSDTDLDRTGLGGTQSASGGWDPSYGKVPELLLGTAIFVAPTSTATAHPGDYAVSLNAFFSTSSGAGGGAVIKSLTGTDTTTNGVSSTNLITGAGQINGAGITVAVAVPEPASIGLLGLAGLGLIRRRRTA